MSTVLETAQALDVHHVTLFEGRKLLGVVCTCDLEELPRDATVGNAVKRPAVMLDISASLAAALERMSREVVGSVLVTRSGDPVGLVTREDLVRAQPTDLPNLRCDNCRAVAHLRAGSRGLLCVDCYSRSHPADEDDPELGGSG